MFKLMPVHSSDMSPMIGEVPDFNNYRGHVKRILLVAVTSLMSCTLLLSRGLEGLCIHRGAITELLAASRRHEFNATDRLTMYIPNRHGGLSDFWRQQKDGQSSDKTLMKAREISSGEQSHYLKTVTFP